MHPKEPQIRPFEIGALDQNQLHGAIFALTQIATPFCRELRRAMPFLARQRARLVLGEAVLASDGTLPEAGEGPSFLVTMESQSDLWAAVSFEIGRASCRERVEIWVVAGASKRRRAARAIGDA